MPDAEERRGISTWTAGTAQTTRQGQPAPVRPVRPCGRKGKVTRRLLAVADLVAATVALLVAVGPSDLRPQAILIPFLLLLTNKLVGLYDRDETVMRRSTLSETPRLAEIAGLFALCVWLFADQFATGELSRTDVLVFWVLVFALMASFRALARALARRVIAPERCAIVADRPAIERIEVRLDNSRVSANIVARMELPGLGSTDEPPNEAEFARWLHEQRVERLVFAPPPSWRAEALDVLRVAQASGVHVSLLPRLFEAVGSSVDFEDVDGMTTLGVRSFGLSRSSRALKRSLDVVGAGIGLLAVSPLMLVIALAVRFTSRGPVLFRQLRVGRDGVQFDMIKFRSMVDGADGMKHELRNGEGPDGLFKLTEDPRVTRVGKTLRATSLDELPQLFNVLRGQMSLVGPRPLVLEEDALIKGLDRHRLHLTPGMTGPWQILGGSRVPLREMVSMDYLYVTNWTLWGDIEILVRTAAHMVRRGGV